MTQRALVTGASGGIGSAIAIRLAEDGYRVVVGYHSAHERALELVDSLPGEGHEALQITVTDPASLAAAAAHLFAIGPDLHVLVNCAGVTRPVAHDDLEGLDDALIDQIFATNWRGPFAAVRSMRPLLDAAEGGSVVVNISSVAAVTGQGSNVAYCASKAALDSMTRSLARSLGPQIRMVSVSPGWVLGEYADRMPTEVIDIQRSQTPLGRLATPADVGAAVSAVVNDLPFTTGTLISVDGGRPLGVS